MRRAAFYAHLVESLEGFNSSAGWTITFRDSEDTRRNWNGRWWSRSCAGGADAREEFIDSRPHAGAGQGDTGSAQQAAAYYDPDKSRAAYATMTPTCRPGRLHAAHRRADLAGLRIRADRRAAVPAWMRPSARVTASERSGQDARCHHRLDNAIIAGHSGVTFGIHICRGNHKSMFYASGGYDRIAEKVFSRAEFHRFLLEYDDERSGSFEPLRHVPGDRTVVLGLVSSKIPRLESADDLRRRIDEAAQIVPLERLALSPQCGFASTHEGNRLTAEDQRKKLELVAKTAKERVGVKVK
jgi:5-methyltetrahydropteroyltriglutamate--homocysteine methyltransferase